MSKPYETALENDIEQRVRDLAGTPEDSGEAAADRGVKLGWLAFGICCSLSGFGFGLLVHFLGWLP